MKKTIQYLSATIVACIAFFACSDPYDDQFVAEPTIYEQQPLQDVDFSATILTDPLIITEENIGETFDFIRITPPTLVDSNVTVAYSVLLSDTEDFDPSNRFGNLERIGTQSLLCRNQRYTESTE